MNKLKEFLENSPRIAFIFAALLGVLFSVLHEGGETLLLPVVSYLQPFLLNGSSSFSAEVIVNCLIQGFIAFGVCIIVVPLFVSTLQPKSMTYPLVAVGADLLYSFWWLPISVYLKQWPVPVEYMPIMYWSSFTTSVIFLGSLFWAVRKSNPFSLIVAPYLMNCPHCKQKISFFSPQLSGFGKIKVCPHCACAIRYSINFKVAGLLLVPAIILALLLKPWLGAFNNVPGLMILLVLATELEPVA